MDWRTAIPATIHAGIAESVPLLLAANGELIGERAGLVNIGIEGTMLVGALAAAATGWATGSPTAAIMAAAAAGALVGLLFAAWTVWAARDQIVTGLAINLLALGLTGVAIERIERYAASQNATAIAPRLAALASFDPTAAPLRHAFLQHDALAYAALLLIIMTFVFFRYTRPGMSLRAVGENPEAADAAGIRVTALRMAAAVAGGVLAALGGAYLTLAISDRFQEGMTNSRGFVALALVIFGRWSASRILLAALFFGGLEALQTTLQPSLGRSVHVLYPALLALPYVFTLVALAGLVGRAHPPAALGTAYRRG